MRILLLIPLLLLVACWERPRLISDCDNVGDRLALCGWQKPEDMEVLGDRQTLIVSEMEAHGSGKPGALALFDTGSREKRRIDLGLAVKTPSEPWGVRNAPRPISIILPLTVFPSPSALMADSSCWSSIMAAGNPLNFSKSR